MNIIMVIGFSLVFLFCSYMRSGRYTLPNGASYYQKYVNACDGFAFYRNSAIVTGALALLFVFGYFKVDEYNLSERTLIATLIFICIIAVIIDIIFAVSFKNKSNAFNYMMEKEKTKKDEKE